MLPYFPFVVLLRAPDLAEFSFFRNCPSTHSQPVLVFLVRANPHLPGQLPQVMALWSTSVLSTWSVAGVRYNRRARVSSHRATENVEWVFIFSLAQRAPKVILAVLFDHSNSWQNVLYLENVFFCFLFRTRTIRWSYVTMQFAQVSFFFTA